MLENVPDLLAKERYLEAVSIILDNNSNEEYYQSILLHTVELISIKNIEIENELLGELLERISKVGGGEKKIIYYVRGLGYEKIGDYDKAEANYTQSLKYQKSFKLAKNRLSKILIKNGNYALAEGVIRDLLEEEPEETYLLTNLAVCLMRQNKLEEAYKYNFKAEGNALEQQKASVMINMGTILQEMGEREKALNYYEQAIKREANSINANLNIGVIYLQNKQLNKAGQYFRKVMKQEPENLNANINYAGILFTQKRDEEGWKYYEKRLDGFSQKQGLQERMHRWDIELETKELLLIHEQGLGDTFQFIRYAKWLKEQGIRCYFLGPKKLHGIIECSRLVTKCIENTDEIPESINVWESVISLGRGKERNLYNSGYIAVAESKVDEWKIRLRKEQKLRVALHWQGNPKHEFTISRGRSLTLKELEPIADIEGIEWISMQKGAGSEQIIGSEFNWSTKQDEISECWDFEDAAAILKNCDILISSDSGLAHLAGGLGIEVWLLVPWLAEWRWGLEGEKTPWYKKHILFRQLEEYNWSDPVEQIKKRLISQLK